MPEKCIITTVEVLPTMYHSTWVTALSLIAAANITPATTPTITQNQGDSILPLPALVSLVSLTLKMIASGPTQAVHLRVQKSLLTQTTNNHLVF